MTHRHTSKLMGITIALMLGLTCAAPEPEEAAEPAPPRAESLVTEQPTFVDPAEPETLLRNGKVPFEGILTGGQPTDEQLEKLSELGYKTVVNLRSPSEPGSTIPFIVNALEMQYVSLPIEGRAGVSEANARRLAEVLDSAEYPVVVHCASGNRVGAIFAMKAFYVDGKTPEEALAIGQEAGVTRLEPAVREILGLSEDQSSKSR